MSGLMQRSLESKMRTKENATPKIEEITRTVDEEKENLCIHFVDLNADRCGLCEYPRTY